MKYCPICKVCYDNAEDRCQKDRIFLIEAFPGPRVVDTKYRIDALIGQGGMGAVYRAMHLELDRSVALKIVLPDFVSSGETLERFRREARAAARLNHPSVITIYDFGVLDNGRAYLAMELLSGKSLREEVEIKGILSPSRALEILQPVCGAVQAAHNAGVIHRDLKPDNIVLERNELGVEIIKVVDFGIAKLREAAGTNAMNLNLTGPGLVMGTPHYMSPEQCKGEELDPCSDIYSLGVMLYEMLCGHVPFDAPTPSAVIIQHAIDPPRRLSLIRKDIKPELEAVVMKALMKSRAARQQSVKELCSELEKAINGTELSAPSLLRAPEPPPLPPVPKPSLSSATPKDLVAATLVEYENDPLSTRLLDDKNISAPKPRRPVSDLDAEANELLAHTTGLPMEDDDDSELDYQSSYINPQNIRLTESAQLQGHEHVVKALAYTPEGQYLISASSDGAIKIWDLKKKRVRGALHGHELSVNALAVSPNGQLLASASADGSVRIWDIAKEQERTKLGGYAGSLRSLVFSPSGQYLVLSHDTNIEMWDIGQKKLVTTFTGHVRLVESLEFSKDGSIIISGGADETIRFWDVNKRTNIGLISCTGHCVYTVASCVDGILATGGKDHSIRLWDITSQTELALLAGHKDSVRSLVFSARGDYLCSGDWSGTIKLWDTAMGVEVIGLPDAHDGAILTVAFSPDEKQIASSGYDQIIKLWNIEGLTDI